MSRDAIRQIEQVQHMLRHARDRALGIIDDQKRSMERNRRAIAAAKDALEGNYPCG